MKYIFLKKLHFRLKMKRRAITRMYISILIILASFLLPVLYVKTNPFGLETEDALVGIASIVITAISAIFIVFQLQDSESVTCCNMLAEMNLSFIENERMMFTYQKLEQCYRNPDFQFIVEDNDDKNSVHTSDLVSYFTFFEVLYEYIKHKVITINQMDDLFGYRFFILVHNKYIQENELYAVPSSYANVFQLYDIWLEYRRVNITGANGRLVLMEENQIPSLYLKKKMYLQERMYKPVYNTAVELSNRKNNCKTFIMKSLFPKDLDTIIELQENVIKTMKDNTILEPSSKEEILESMLVDCCLGLFSNEKLVAFSIIVFNRNTPRNLCLDWQSKKTEKMYCDFITFDSVQVHPEFRGYGIQKYFLSLAEKIAIMTKSQYVVATVSPKNEYSFDNFKTLGYFPHKSKNPYIKYGKERILLAKKIADEL